MQSKRMRFSLSFFFPLTPLAVLSAAVMIQFAVRAASEGVRFWIEKRRERNEVLITTGNSCGTRSSVRVCVLLPLDWTVERVWEREETGERHERSELAE